MSVSPSLFGQPVQAPPPAPEPVTEPGSRRTAVIAVAAGVVALGVLGGAAFLVLGGEDPATQATPSTPAATVPGVEPSEPAAVSTPLPTAAVLGRNVFVPAVRTAAEVEAERAAAQAAADAEAARKAEAAAQAKAEEDEESGAGFGSGSGTGSGSAAASEEQVRRILELQAQIATLTQQLAAAGDTDGQLRDQIQVLRTEYDLLLAENEDLAVETERLADTLSDYKTVTAVTVDLESPGEPVVLLVGDQERRLDRDPATTDVSDRLVLGTTSGGVDVELLYHAAEAPAVAGEAPVVTFLVGSSYYRVPAATAITLVVR